MEGKKEAFPLSEDSHEECVRAASCWRALVGWESCLKEEVVNNGDNPGLS